MWMSLILCIVCLDWLSTLPCCDAYRIVRISTDTSPITAILASPGNVFLLHRGVYRYIEHEDTWLSFGFSDKSDCTPHSEKAPSQEGQGHGQLGGELHSWRTGEGSLSEKYIGTAICIREVSFESIKSGGFKEGPPVPLIKKLDNTPDEFMRVELLRVEVLQGWAPGVGGAAQSHSHHLLQNAVCLGVYINPSVVPWRGQLLMASGLAWLESDGQVASETLNFKLVSPDIVSRMNPHSKSTNSNVTSSSITSPEKAKALGSVPVECEAKGLGYKTNTYADVQYSMLGIGQLLQPLDRYILGQDPRLVVLSDDCILVMFTNRFTKRISVGLAILTVNGTTRAENLRNAYPAGEGAAVYIPPEDHLFPKKHWGQWEFLATAKRTPLYRGHSGEADDPYKRLVVSQLYPQLLVPVGKGSESGEFDLTNHKNWVPFLYYRTAAEDSGSGNDRVGTGTAQENAHTQRQTRVLFIQQIDPLTVAEVQWDTVNPATGSVYMKTVSIDRGKGKETAVDADPKPRLSKLWGFGRVRGGTPALHIGNGRYLAFFHSSTKVGVWFKTYVMGAFTFTDTAPFRLLEVTPYPIMHPRFYSGGYAEQPNRQIDYVSFPMSFYLEEEEEGLRAAGNVNSERRVAILSFGAQDREGWLARVSLKALFESMVPVPFVDTDAGNGTTSTTSITRRLMRVPETQARREGVGAGVGGTRRRSRRTLLRGVRAASQ